MDPGQDSPVGGVSVALVQRIQAGEQKAWEELYGRYRDRLLFSIRCRLGAGLRRHLQSEDILQSVIKDAVSDLAGFVPRAPGALEHYLHVCVLNKIRNRADHFAARKRRGTVTLTDEVAATLPATPATAPGYRDAARYERLEAAMARLPEPMREAVLLRRIEQLPNREVARLLGITEAAAFKLYSRAMARLGQMLRGAGD